MGASSSATRSPASMQAELERLRSKEMDLQEEHDKQLQTEEMKHEAKVSKLEAEKFELAETLRVTTAKLGTQTERWKKEQSRALALMFSDLPLHLLQSDSLQSANLNSMMTRTFPLVTVAQCDVVGFSSLSARLPPEQVVHIIDRLHSLIDEAFTDSDIFIMEYTSDGCIAVSGLLNFQEKSPPTPISMTDSSYGSEDNIADSVANAKCRHPTTSPTQMPNFYAGKMATAALKLMSYSSRISVPLPDKHALQLRVALHTGPCSAGVIGLQRPSSASQIPHYKLFGPTMRYLQTLCSSGLALQVRVSKQCRDLLVEGPEEFEFERCPDYMMVSNREPLESYWLVAKDDLPLKMPLLSDAVSLCDYDTIEC